MPPAPEPWPADLPDSRFLISFTGDVCVYLWQHVLAKLAESLAERCPQAAKGSVPNLHLFTSALKFKRIHTTVPRRQTGRAFRQARTHPYKRESSTNRRRCRAGFHLGIHIERYLGNILRGQGRAERDSELMLDLQNHRRARTRSYTGWGSGRVVQ